jgi:hypothetical protein
LECLATDAGYPFDADDWTAVRFGLLEAEPATDETEIEFAYSLIGTRRVDLRLCFEPRDSAVRFGLIADPSLGPARGRS